MKFLTVLALVLLFEVGQQRSLHTGNSAVFEYWVLLSVAVLLFAAIKALEWLGKDSTESEEEDDL